MKIIHTSDWHLGKRVNEFSMLEEQKEILWDILALAVREQPELLIIAGDIYDKSTPPTEAVALFDSFLTAIARAKIPVAIISGNHDSPERIAFGTELMRENGVYISPVYNGALLHFTLKDSFGEAEVYLLPFLRPSAVRKFADCEISTYNSAVQWAVSQAKIDKRRRNILVAHQFVMGAVPSESEEINVGGLDGVSEEIFADFDYVALGHIHRSQGLKSEKIRYSGTPLKYSFSEALHEKSVTLVELREKGDITITKEKLTPKRDMREIKGSFAKLTDPAICTPTKDYLHITLTDEEEIVDAVEKLRPFYENILRLDYDNARTRALGIVAPPAENKTPSMLFREFYAEQNGTELSEEQSAYVNACIRELWEGEE
ncbi:MAG: exonuclease SbcCD subunit D [Oscillospiraceae bacterium]